MMGFESRSPPARQHAAQCSLAQPLQRPALSARDRHSQSQSCSSNSGIFRYRVKHTLLRSGFSPLLNVLFTSSWHVIACAEQGLLAPWTLSVRPAAQAVHPVQSKAVFTTTGFSGGCQKVTQCLVSLLVLQAVSVQALAAATLTPFVGVVLGLWQYCTLPQPAVTWMVMPSWHPKPDYSASHSCACSASCIVTCCGQRTSCSSQPPSIQHLKPPPAASSGSASQLQGRSQSMRMTKRQWSSEMQLCSLWQRCS